MLSYGFLVVYFIYNPLSRVTRTVIALMLGNAAANLQKLERNWPRGYVWCELVVVMFVAPIMIVYQIRDATLRKPVLDLAVRLYATAIITVKRFMVKIADTFVVTAKYWIRINARRCWPAGEASIKGTTAFENTTLYSQSTCSHLHTIRYGPHGTPLTPTLPWQDCLLSTSSLSKKTINMIICFEK